MTLPINRPDRQQVRQAFERAARSYDGAADVQRRVCQALLQCLPPACQPASLLDAGCGTGYGLTQLHTRFPAARTLAVDLSTGMLQQVSAPAGRLVGDLEQLPLATGSVDLYWSSLALQWCDLPRALGEAARVLRPGGWLAIATLGPRTFHELRTAFAGVDGYEHTLSFQTLQAVQAQVAAAGFMTEGIENPQEIAHYPELRALLHSVKAVGANQIGPGRRTGLMSRSALATVDRAYETLRTAGGLPLTYDVILLIARK